MNDTDARESIAAWPHGQCTAMIGRDRCKLAADHYGQHQTVLDTRPAWVRRAMSGTLPVQDRIGRTRP